jgi:hypothetical protein
MRKKMKLVGQEAPPSNNRITVSPQPAAEEPKPVVEEPKVEPVVEEVEAAEEAVATEDSEEVSPKRSRKKQADSEEN